MTSLEPVQLGMEAVVRLQLEEALARLPRPVALRWNQNRRILISLRGGGLRPFILSLHPALLAYPQAIHDLPGWVAQGRRRITPAIRAALDAAGRDLARQQRAREAPIELEPLGGPLDLEACFREVHQTFFPHLRIPALGWSRRVGRKHLRHVRFASYQAQKSRVLVSRRLDQPWVAKAFVRFVLYHELCHHAIALDPRRGDTAHGPRFRALERRFPDYERVVRWERQQLQRFTDAMSLRTVEPALPPVRTSR